MVSIMPSHKNVSKKMRTELFDMVMEQITCDTMDPKKRKADDIVVGARKKHTPNDDDVVTLPSRPEVNRVMFVSNELVMHEAIFNARSQLNAQEQAARKEALKDLKREEEVRAAARASRLADLREELRIRTALAAVGDSAMF